MPVRAIVRSSFYQDSVALMRVAQELRARPGVQEVAALMGTPANHALLAAAGLATPGTDGAGPGDLILAVGAESAAVAAAALAAADGLFAGRRRTLETAVLGHRVGMPPRTLDSALRRLPRASLVTISVPGSYAKAEAMRALRHGLHVFLFSDNVPLDDEVALKTYALQRGLLCMGPDCGTAYVDGVGLGFANVVPRGRIGIVAASGTGLQAVASRVAALGQGISHGIGVGGRDLSAEVGGLMAGLALATLARDPATALVVLVSKPTADVVLPTIEAALAALGKPAVVCCLGAPPGPGRSGRWVSTLADAAEAAVATLRGAAWQPRAFRDAGGIRARLARIEASAARRGPSLLALFTGGTLAHEARLLLEPLLGPVTANLQPAGVSRLTPSATGASPHQVLDLGADEFTAGRPHPMLDPEARAARVRAAGRAPHVGILLLDVVLGRMADRDPAGPLAAAIRDARAAAAAEGRSLDAVASVVGTAEDPQGLSAQIAALEAAGAAVLPSSAEAARFAALLTRPGLAGSLLDDRRP